MFDCKIITIYQNENIENYVLLFHLTESGRPLHASDIPRAKMIYI